MNHVILGIESSCDETSAAVIRGNDVLSNIVSSQEIHSEFGGVVPELASRAHIRLITMVVQKALSRAGVDKEALDGIAVTYGPGLVGALLVGLSMSKGLATSLKIPYIGINHIEGHIYGNFLSNPDIEFPHLSLIVSGGHTQIVIMEDHLAYKIIGKTRDDAVGEAFDKGSKILGLGYPGGPLIDKISTSGNAAFHHFPRATLKNGPFDFSYSGLKTSLLVYCQSKTEEFIRNNLADICASYQRAAIEVLVNKTVHAARQFGVKSAGVVGGVAANSLLRSWMSKEMSNLNIKFYVPEMAYCTDNAAMIARAGMERLRQGMHSSLELNAVPSLPLTTEQDFGKQNNQ